MGLGKFVFIVWVVVNFGGCTANVTVSHILHKLKCGYYNYSVEIYFEFCSDKRLRSYSSNKLKINKVRTELFKGTFFNRLPYLWNNLPDKLRTSNLSLSLFKKQCNEFYKKKSFDPDHPHATWM